MSGPNTFIHALYLHCILSKGKGCLVLGELWIYFESDLDQEQFISFRRNSPNFVQGSLLF